MAGTVSAFARAAPEQGPPFSVPRQILARSPRTTSRAPVSLPRPALPTPPGSGALLTRPSSENPSHSPSSEDRCALCPPHRPAGLWGSRRDPAPRVGCGGPSHGLAEPSLPSCLPRAVTASHASRTAPLRTCAAGVQLHGKGPKTTAEAACGYTSQEEAHRPPLPSRSPSPSSLQGSAAYFL